MTYMKEKQIMMMLYWRIGRDVVGGLVASAVIVFVFGEDRSRRIRSRFGGAVEFAALFLAGGGERLLEPRIGIRFRGEAATS